MYLTKLMLNPRCRRVRADLASPYEMHRTLLRAFPDRDAGGPGRVLYRVEPTRDGAPPLVLVQSEKKPDWGHLTGVPELAAYATSVQEKRFEPAFQPGQKLRFRLRANPTVKRDGKRYGLHTDEQHDAWLRRKAGAGGFRVLSYRIIGNETVSDRVKNNGGARRRATFTSTWFEGVLEVADPGALLIALSSGIGVAKGFGFGLLSVAPVH